ncbi:protein ALP1-like [Cimex lectularius]|uniref:DDE Tnp4 domain-containing protein n=1 Tax=Cimex lectularius TaxID=79782 RepID=A0A8I6SP11_CIMLE|nr:protein ALP1-like [Cimex lectularius]
MQFSELELAAIAVALDEEERENHVDRLHTAKRRWGVHPTWRKRKLEGEFATLYKELLDDESKFFGYFRMSWECFNVLLLKVKSGLTKQKTFFQEPISPSERLAVCLRFLATGDSFKSISYSYRLGHSTVCQIVNSTCRTIVTELMNEVMPQPTEESWKAVARDFEALWNFPNCIGALDGKHFTIEAPANSGSLYFNYKHTHSIVLLALVDARYKFITVDVGSYGRNSDGGIFARSSLGKRLENGTLNIPSGKYLPNTTTVAPYVIVADEAFPLKTYLLRPYPGRQSAEDTGKTSFNNKLSLARRLVENAFGILTQRFRIYCRRIKMAPENVDYVILATCVLHNFLRERSDSVHLPHSYNDGTQNSQPQPCFEPLRSQPGRPAEDAFAVRELFKNYLATTAAHGVEP